MSNIPIGFTEGPPANPFDASNIVAIIGYCSGSAPSSNPDAPNVIIVDSPGQTAAAGYGPGPELASLISRRGKRRCLLVPCSASTPGVLSAVTQVGQGPVVTAASVDANGPRDDATVSAVIRQGGAPGVATVALSWSYLLTNGVPSPLYQSPIVVPARAPAQFLGTVDLTTIAYARPAIVSGTVDLATLAWGPSGDLDGETLIVTLEGVGPTTVTFSAPASPAALVTAINAATSSSMASLSQQNHLVLTGTVYGTSSAIVNGAGTANTHLGLTGTHTTNGTAGALDGLTVLFDDDASAGQTVTFSSPKPNNAAAVIAKINGATGIVADAYTAKNVLRLRSTTNGSASSLQVTGGTGLATLGLSVMTAAATGAESTYTIAHLGVTLTFSPNAQGVFVASTSYAATCKAPKPSDADIALRVTDLKASGQPFGVIVIASETDVTSSLARAQALDASATALHAKDLMKRFVFGFDPAESDANIASTFAAFRSAWVDRCARGAYLRVSSNVLGGGDMLRSVSWAAAFVDAFIPYYKDRGDRGILYDAGIIGLPDVDGITADEDTATVPLVGPVGASGTSCNVLTKDPDGGYYFKGAYSSADGTSRYTDASVRNTMLRMAEIVAFVLARFQNDTDLDTKPDETLTAASAEIVNSSVEGAVKASMVPSALQAVRCAADETIKFYSLKKLAATVTGYNRVPARSVSGTVGPGIILNG